MSMSIEDDFYFHSYKNIGSNAPPRGPIPPMTLYTFATRRFPASCKRYHACAGCDKASTPCVDCLCLEGVPQGTASFADSFLSPVLSNSVLSSVSPCRILLFSTFRGHETDLLEVGDGHSQGIWPRQIIHVVNEVCTGTDCHTLLGLLDHVRAGFFQTTNRSRVGHAGTDGPRDQDRGPQCKLESRLQSCFFCFC